MKREWLLGLAAVGLVAGVGPLAAADRQVMPPRVPADKLKEARALTSPLPDSSDILEKGEALYNGKGTCFNCHGKDGMGNGPAAVGLDPSPRNFHQHGFWQHRTEGEIFWVIKHGSTGTAMVGFGNMLTDEEIWTLVRYLHSFAGDRGPRERMGRMGPRSDMGEMESDGPRGGMGRGEGGCCKAGSADRLE